MYIAQTVQFIVQVAHIRGAAQTVPFIVQSVYLMDSPQTVLCPFCPGVHVQDSPRHVSVLLLLSLPIIVLALICPALALICPALALNCPCA